MSYARRRWDTPPSDDSDTLGPNLDNQCRYRDWRTDKRCKKSALPGKAHCEEHSAV